VLLGPDGLLTGQLQAACVAISAGFAFPFRYLDAVAGLWGTGQASTCTPA
jgi:hypothetical protein